MSGTCKYCGFSGTNDEMMEHAGEMCWERVNQVDAIVSPNYRCKCGKIMKYWDGCCMGSHGVDYEGCEDPQYKCECGNVVYLDFDK